MHQPQAADLTVLRGKAKASLPDIALRPFFGEAEAT